MSIELTDRNGVNAIGELLATLRLPHESAVSVTYTANAPGDGCRGGFISVTVKTHDDEQTSSAVSLQDAMLLVRGKIDRARAAKEKAKAEMTGGAA